MVTSEAKSRGKQVEIGEKFELFYLESVKKCKKYEINTMCNKNFKDFSALSHSITMDQDRYIFFC